MGNFLKFCSIWPTDNNENIYFLYNDNIYFLSLLKQSQEVFFFSTESSEGIFKHFYFVLVLLILDLLRYYEKNTVFGSFFSRTCFQVTFS